MDDWIDIKDALPGVGRRCQVQDIRGEGAPGILHLQGDITHGVQATGFVFSSPENYPLYNVTAWRYAQGALGSVDTTEIGTLPENTK